MFTDGVNPAREEDLTLSVVLKWEQPLSAESVRRFLLNRNGQNELLITLNPAVSSALWKMKSAQELAMYTNQGKFQIDGHNVTVEPLVREYGPKPDTLINALNVFPGEEDQMHLLAAVLGTIVERRRKQFMLLYEAIDRELQDFMLAPRIECFGSMKSRFRRTASSDADLNVWYDTVLSSPRNIRSREELLKPTRPLANVSKAEMEKLKPKERIQLLGAHFRRSESRLVQFGCSITTIEAKCPIVMVELGSNVDFLAAIDVSIDNEAGVKKSDLLDLFIERDQSEMAEKITRFFHFWAKTNNIICKRDEHGNWVNRQFNSYILHHLVIHFVQTALGVQLVREHPDRERRCDPYSIRNRWKTYRSFFKKFFIYLANLDYNKFAIFNATTVLKGTIMSYQSTTSAALVVADPLETMHNIAQAVSTKALAYFKKMIRYSLHLLKCREFSLNAILNVEENFQKQVAMKLAAPAAHFADIDGSLVFLLPEVIHDKLEVLHLLIRIMGWIVSATHRMGSIDDIETPKGIIFLIFKKAWVGRRHHRSQVKALYNIDKGLESELLISKIYQKNPPIRPSCIVNVRLQWRHRDGVEWKFLVAKVLNGAVADMRDALHFIIHQFVPNYTQELVARNGMNNLEVENPDSSPEQSQ
ncbi:unnamed protein product [Caenorhabditis auriculariae]|uniref:Poly(A) RNA polymerase mitochondrial-like central palm domain-containing protein n=1 Tax=Caenorhabditis auriculariae TaxID=2777116 RepID=A0A8S1HAB2_9PELO|nr:unnamed protein product [Caenorhabditis auriculariae]